uniref:Uncharacterized protein n=4 Tax=Oryza TaxID=4527 RepID=Q6YUU9_ORYSJ|nr:hypothetical protein [Oryza sativa Japonica Group]BAD16471.1 hypothetical protein [Oryza sativa Japonica Group]
MGKDKVLLVALVPTDPATDYPLVYPVVKCNMSRLWGNKYGNDLFGYFPLLLQILRVTACSPARRSKASHVPDVAPVVCNSGDNDGDGYNNRSWALVMKLLSVIGIRKLF